MVWLAVLLCLLLLVSLVNSREEYDSDRYDYDRENPNALVSGYSVAGTVYSSYPGNTPGLGWIL
mgnify:CR=1 FL=1